MKTTNTLSSLFVICIFVMLYSPVVTFAQTAGYWQQEVHYKMDIDMNVETNQFTGKQKLTYINHSPDTLSRVFYHLFFNAFQPNSMMDERSRTISDPSRKIADKILGYDSTEIGYQHIDQLKQDGKKVSFKVEDTILEVTLAEPILPGESTEFEMEFNAQVPLQTRRSGRDNAEGVRYSMAQWYPKMVEYDEDGWHPNPYIGREFYAPFGTFDVTIHIDKNYVIAAASVLQNPQEIGFGYEKEGTKVKRPKGDKLTWHFKSKDVHDFMWAADPDFVQTTAQVPDGPLVRFFHQASTDSTLAKADPEKAKEWAESWEELPAYTVKNFEFMNENVGKYPYPEYSVIQGGDGGMEYIMGTLITGNRSLRSLVGVTVHEMNHSWFQGVLASNEVYYAWMDEGFTSYWSGRGMSNLFGNGEETKIRPSTQRYRGYMGIVQKGLEEPMHIHSDHYVTNGAYSTASYSKGSMFLAQLSYITGQDVLDKSLRRYFATWKLKHPDGKDMLRIVERESGMVLDWYYEYWVTTTKTIDYGIKSVEKTEEGTQITLQRIGLMPMPTEVEVTTTDSTSTVYYMPLRIMWGEKENEYLEKNWVQKEDWEWVFPEYTLTIDQPLDSISKIEIDASQRMADMDRDNNVWPAPPKEEEPEKTEG